MRRTLGIVGFGRFGRLAAAHLKEHFDLVVYDKEDRGEAAEDLGVSAAPLRDVAGCGVVLLCVPISEMEVALRAIAPHVVRGALVVDTCSVKEYPISLMKAILPGDVEVLGTHPLFGPDSAGRGIAGKKIVLCPVLISDPRKVVRFLERLGLQVLICSPETHDKRMASTQAIVQFLGRAFLAMGLTHEKMATPGYDRLIGILEVVQNDTMALFRDLQIFNRFTGDARRRLIESLAMIDRSLDEGPPWTSR